jgi:hypothetical protein
LKPRDNAGFFNLSAIKKEKNIYKKDKNYRKGNKKQKNSKHKLSDKNYKQQMIYLKDIQG